MKRPKTDWDRVPWTPFEEASLPKMPPDLAAVVRTDKVFMNSRYQVNVTVLEPHPIFGPSVQLSIKTLDKSARHDWRDLQRIKNEICGPECEAIEIYPAESRLVDTANQFFLFVFRDFKIPFGFTERLVADGNWGNSKQRPWPKDDRPADCKDKTAWDAYVAQVRASIPSDVDSNA